MKIALLAAGTALSPLTARMINLGRELAQQGHQVFLFAPSADKYSHFKKESFTELHDITIVRCPQFMTRNSTINLLPYIPVALFKLLWLRADIVHLYKPTPVTIIGLIAGWRQRTKVILDMDDLGSEVMRRMGLPQWVVALTAWCEHMAAKHADGILVVSTYLRAYYKKIYPNRPVQWVPNGVSAIGPSPTVAKQPRIIFIGSLDTTQIVEPLIRALPAVVTALSPRTPRLRIIGDGTERTQLERLVAELHLTRYVEFTGWIAHDKLPTMVRGGDIGYCCVPNEPPYKAASTQKIFDYMALGILPVVNRVGDLPTYVDHGKVGYVTDDTTLATTLVAALIDQHRAARVAAGHKHVANHYLWRILAKTTVQFYKKVQG